MSDLPPNLPTLVVDDETLESRFWRRVVIGETVKSHFQTYVLIPYRHWRLTGYSTRDSFVNQGLGIYRAPASFRAWCVVLSQLMRKWWRRNQS